jgi:adenosylcobinamide-GDP ribazoletransferase
VSRLMPVFIIRLFDYVTDPDTSKVKPQVSQRPSVGSVMIAIICAGVPFIFLNWYFLLAVLPVAVVAWQLAVYFKKWIGGYTGDCLGAIQQVSELMFYLGALIVWRYFL